jgi:hypothetical protein
MTRVFLLILLGACAPKVGDDSGSCSDGDADGVCDDSDVCDGGDDTQDHDGDGVPNACEIDLLAEFGDAPAYLDTSSTQLAIQLAYDVHLTVDQWRIFEPGLVVSDAERSASAWTRDLSGWDQVQERLTDGEDQDFCTYVTGLEDGFRIGVTQPEAFYDLTGLEGAEVNQVTLELLVWFHEDAQLVISPQWYFHGYVP